jgi:hypothetical protein
MKLGDAILECPGQLKIMVELQIMIGFAGLYLGSDGARSRFSGSVPNP